jgi:hypothetical protein
MSETLMFDFSAFYDKIAAQMPNDCKLAEIGIANGDSVIYLAKALLKLGKKFKIYAIDNMDYGGFLQMKEVYQNLIKEGVGEYIEVIPKDSITASKDFNDGYLDFLFLDSSHTYLETKESIRCWYSKVKDEAIFAGHDFAMAEVSKAVLEVVPKTFKRNDISDRDFEMEDILHTEDTSNGFGIWWFKKQWYLKLK